MRLGKSRRMYKKEGKRKIMEKEKKETEKLRKSQLQKERR